MTQSPAAATKSGGSNLIPMVIISVLFFIFGFVTWLNGILIPYLKIACQLSNFQAMFVAFAFYIAYFVMGTTILLGSEKIRFQKRNDGWPLGDGTWNLTFYSRSHDPYLRTVPNRSFRYGYRTDNPSNCCQSICYNIRSQRKRCPTYQHHGYLQ